MRWWTTERWPVKAVTHLCPQVAYRELSVEAGDRGGDVAKALGDFLWSTWSEQPGDLGSGDTHKAGDREVQEVQAVDGRAQGGGCRGEGLDRGDDRVGALGHGADRTEDDGGDKGPVTSWLKNFIVVAG